MFPISGRCFRDIFKDKITKVNFINCFAIKNYFHHIINFLSTVWINCFKLPKESNLTYLFSLAIPFKIFCVYPHSLLKHIICKVITCVDSKYSILSSSVAVPIFLLISKFVNDFEPMLDFTISLIFF